MTGFASKFGTLLLASALSLAVAELTGIAEDTPRPAPLVSAVVARQNLPTLRLPAWLPAGAIGPTFQILDSQPIVVLSYNYPLDSATTTWFQIREAPADLATAVLPQPLEVHPERSAVGLVGVTPSPAFGPPRVVEPRAEERAGFHLVVVSGLQCRELFCDRPLPFTRAMAQDDALAIHVEGYLDEETAVNLLLSAFR